MAAGANMWLQNIWNPILDTRISFVGLSVLSPSRSGRVMLIFEDRIFFIWNHLFYCLVRRADFKNVFVFMIGPILVVRIKI